MICHAKYRQVGFKWLRYWWRIIYVIKNIIFKTFGIFSKQKWVCLCSVWYKADWSSILKCLPSLSSLNVMTSASLCFHWLAKQFVSKGSWPIMIKNLSICFDDYFRDIIWCIDCEWSTMQEDNTKYCICELCSLLHYMHSSHSVHAGISLSHGQFHVNLES